MLRDFDNEIVYDLVAACKAALEVLGDECSYDHHGYCQEHHLRTNAYGNPECEVKLLREAISAFDKEEQHMLKEERAIELKRDVLNPAKYQYLDIDESILYEEVKDSNDTKDRQIKISLEKIVSSRRSDHNSDR